MKKTIPFLILSLWVLSGSAQDNTESTARPSPFNAIKFQPFNLIFNSVSFEYEGMVSERNALTLQVGIPNHKEFDTDYINLDFFSKVQNAELGTTSIKLALRHYFDNQKLVPAGFYIEPYIKYQNIKGNGLYIGTDENLQSYFGETDLKLNTFNAGIQFGAQFLLGKRIAVDVYFFGLEAGLANGDMTIISSNATKIAEDINDALARWPSFLANQLTVTQSQYKVNVNAKNALYPWFRAGIGIGIAF